MKGNFNGGNVIFLIGLFDVKIYFLSFLKTLLSFVVFDIYGLPGREEQGQIIRKTRRVKRTRIISKSKYIPSLIIEMISSGEASGELENMLIKVSKYLQDRFNHSTKITLNLLEPAVIIFMGGFVS